MIPLLIGCALWLPAVLGLGAALLAVLRVDGDDGPDGALRLSVCGALGILVLSVLGNAANFFVPLHPYAALAAWALGAVAAWRHRRLLLASVRPLDAPGLSALLLVSCAAVAVTPVVFDEGLYVLPTIKWVSDSPLPLGLTNLYHRLGFNSAWCTWAAILEAPRLHGRGLHLSLGLISFLFGLVAYDGLRRGLRGDLSSSSLVAMAAAYPWGLVVLRGWLDYPPSAVWLSLTDAGSTYVVVLALVLMLRRTSRPAQGLTEALAVNAVAVLAATGKLSCAPLVPATLALLAFRARRARRSAALHTAVVARPLRAIAAVAVVASSVWMLRGVGLSGGIAFPSGVGHFSGLPWALDRKAPAAMRDTVKWSAREARWPPRKGTTVEWLGAWSERVRALEAVRVSMMLAGAGCVLLLGAVIVAASRRRARDALRPAFDRDSLVAGAAMLAGVAHCFLLAPDPRFALGFVFGLGAWLAACGLSAAGLARVPRPLAIVVALGIVAAGARGGRLVPIQPELLVPQWPRIPAPTYDVRQTDAGVRVYVTEMAYQAPLPNTPYLDRLLDIRLGRRGLPVMIGRGPDGRRGEPTRIITQGAPSPTPPAPSPR